MGLFSGDIIEKEIPLTLKMQFAIDLQDMIRRHHKDLIATQRTRGYEGVLFLLHMYILNVKRRVKYHFLRVEPKMEFGITTYDSDGTPHWRPDPEKNGWVTHIKGDYYITILTDGYNFVPDLQRSNWEEYGEVIIILDRYMREKKFKVCDYVHDWATV